MAEPKSVFARLGKRYANYVVELEDQLRLVRESMAVVEFDCDGHVLDANEQYLNLMGYGLDELRSKHHRIFVTPQEAQSKAYAEFWERLARGGKVSDRFRQLRKDSTEVWLQATCCPLIKSNGSASRIILYATDVTSSMHERRDLLRANRALDNVTTSVMLTDAERRIVYMNRPLEDLLARAEPDLRKVLPRFDLRKVMGSKIDALLDDLTDQSRLLENLRDEHTTLIKVGDRTLELTLNPLFDDDGDQRGAVVEWREPKDEMAVEEEVNALVAAAVAGDFSRRIVLDGKEGFFLSLAQGMNELLETSEGAFQELQKMLGAMAQGDLTKRITANYSGMFAQLKDDANATMDKLTEMVLSISVAAESINVAANQISAGNTDLSSRTEEQAASLEQTASSLEELTATVKQNADNAKQANGQAKDASKVATRGGDLVQQVVATMADITESSKKISEIISVIDGIAFQTNILALNAAVEAARAGEQGRGFAVVAGEVRNLAQRSAASAKEIKQLISDSVGKINSGTELVNRAGTTMDDIVTAVKQVMENMSDITAASTEQSAGIEQVSQAVTQMDEVTQQNAALVEEASAAARAMVEQTGTMAGLVNEFRITNKAARELQRRQAEESAALAAIGDGAPTAAQPVNGHGLGNEAVGGSAFPARAHGSGHALHVAASKAGQPGPTVKTNGKASASVAAMARNEAEVKEQWATF